MTINIRWGHAEQAGFRLHLARTDRGLCYVGSPGEELEEMQHYCAKRFPDAEMIHDQTAVQEYSDALHSALDGAGEKSTLPLDAAGTSFQQAVWDALQEIPYGETISYSELAFRIGRPTAIRAAASAVAANPLLIFIPCHRVIRKSGNVTGFRGGMDLKHHLLETESQNKSRQPEISG